MWLAISDELAAPLADQLHHRPGAIVRGLDHERLERLARLAVDLAEDHLRLADRKLVAFAAHGLDQNGEMQHAAAGDGELLGRDDRLDPQGDVLLQFAQQPLAEVAAGDELAFAAGQRRGVHAEGHLQRRLVDLQSRQRLRLQRRGNGVADFDPLDADDGTDVAGVDLVDLDAAEVLEDVDRNGLGRRDAIVGLHQGDVLAFAESARLHPADGDTSDVIGPVERGDQHLQGTADVDVGARDFFEDHVHQQMDVAGRLGGIVGGVAQLGAGEDVGEIGQNVVGPQLQEQVEHLVDDFVRSGVGPVDLVDDDDRPQPALERLCEDEPRLRHGPFGGIDQHQRAVGHAQHALDLAAEIGVAGRVDDVDLHAAVRNGDVLGEDRDPALAFQVVGIENLLADELGFAEPPALAQHAIDQASLAVVDVCDDGDVAYVVAAHERGGLSATASLGAGKPFSITASMWGVKVPWEATGKNLLCRPSCRAVCCSTCCRCQIHQMFSSRKDRL